MDNPDTNASLEVCPYDKSHVILKSRMLAHLSKCLQNFPLAEKRPCPFNNKHIIPEPEMQYHMENCPDSGKLTNYYHRVGDVDCPVKNLLPIKIDMPASNENWDTDDHPSSVLTAIKEKAAEKDIIRTNELIGQTKSKRKGFRMDEVRRHQEMREKKIQQANKSKPTPPVELKADDDDDKPIRLPAKARGESRNSKRPVAKLVSNGEEAVGGCVDVDAEIRLPAKARGESRNSKRPVVKSVSGEEAVGGCVDVDAEIRLPAKARGESRNSKRPVLKSVSNGEEAVGGCVDVDAGDDTHVFRSLDNYQELRSRRCNEPRSYASLLAQLNSRKNDCGEIITRNNITEPRGRGRVSPLTAESLPTMLNNISLRSNNATPSNSVCSEASTSDQVDRFPTDIHGFLATPLPGRGRGRNPLL